MTMQIFFFEIVFYINIITSQNIFQKSFEISDFFVIFVMLKFFDKYCKKI